ncbi:hypothetical protein JCM11491_002277 [Sporobolomyces phaffii]
MYRGPKHPQYLSGSYGYAGQLDSPSTSEAASTSLHALSRAALGHSTGQHLAPPDRTRPLVPAMADPAAPRVDGGRSASPASAMHEDDEPQDTTRAAAKKTGKAVAKPIRKRGRKRIEEDLAAIDANDSLDADAKRKLQNRAAQRAFRERKERHVVDLEEKVVQQEAELAQCHELIEQSVPVRLELLCSVPLADRRDSLARLRAENEALRRGENPVPTPSSLKTGNSASPPDVKPALETRLSSGASPSFHHILNEPSEAPPAPARFESASTSPSLLLPTVPTDTTPSVSSQSPMPPPPPAIAALDGNFDSSFDFDAPFDFSESMALPPLFASLLDDLSLPPSTDTDGNVTRVPPYDPESASIDTAMSLGRGASTNPNSMRDVVDPDADADADADSDDEDPPALPLGRIPCDKPECDFTAVSCALPIPWRPPNAPTGAGDKDLWIAQKCWAKLVSHPLFDRCDPDDLCQELRDKTRCSDDGRLVCHKNDVCDIFRSIPQKAKVRQLLQS